MCPLLVGKPLSVAKTKRASNRVTADCSRKWYQYVLVPIQRLGERETARPCYSDYCYEVQPNYPILHTSTTMIPVTSASAHPPSTPLSGPAHTTVEDMGHGNGSRVVQGIIEASKTNASHPNSTLCVCVRKSTLVLRARVPIQVRTGLFVASKEVPHKASWPSVPAMDRSLRAVQSQRALSPVCRHALRFRSSDWAFAFSSPARQHANTILVPPTTARWLCGGYVSSRQAPPLNPKHDAM